MQLEKLEKKFKSINYKIKRRIVRARQRRARKSETAAIKNMNSEQRKIFEMVKEFSTKYKSSIKFDPYSSEILIVLPKMLITLKHYNVFIDNTNGFLSIHLSADAYEFLIKHIYNEVHREKRRLLYEAKSKMNDFLTKVSENNKNESVRYKK